MSTYNYKMFKYFSRKFHLTQQSAPPDVLEAFTKYTGGAPTMSAEQLWLFLVEHQGETECSEEESIRIVEYMQRFRQHSGTNTDKNKPSNDAQSDDSNGLTLDDFFDFLLLDSFNYPVKPKQVHHDMNLPLSHYFIYTGHNSYLTGNQLSSDCSDVPIIKALHRGVRVIELDLWPNSAKDGIEVVHGRTLTAPVSLTQCYVSIREHAFAASQYPVIITLEDHLTPDLQAMVAELTTQIFGDLLHYPDQTEGMTEFPTPESLKGRILISTRPPTEFLGSKQFRDKDYERESPDEGGSSPNPANNGVEADEKSNNASDGDEEDSSANGKKPSTTEYKRLITIHAGKPKGHLRDSLKTDGHVRRLSLSEQELEKASSSYGTDIVRYTQKHIIRVYPKGTRVNSSNYRPHIGWIYGAQMVALNMQGYGKSLWYMQGMFRANGGCGYVRKPSFLVEKNDRGEDFDPKRLLPVKKILKVKVHMGTGWSSDFSKTHFDTFSPPDFYIRVGIVGVAADKMSKKTKVIFDNWFPVWDEEFEFPLTVPELALLSVEVREYDKHEKDDFGGQTCLPIFELRPGFRAVPLYDERGDKFQNVKLLMRFQFR